MIAPVGSLTLPVRAAVLPDCAKTDIDEPNATRMRNCQKRTFFMPLPLLFSVCCVGCLDPYDCAYSPPITRAAVKKSSNLIEVRRCKGWHRPGISFAANLRYRKLKIALESTRTRVKVC